MNKAFEKILDKLEELRETYDEMAFIEMDTNGHTLDFEYAKGKKDVMLDVKEIVQEVAEEYKGGWIACSERLPEEYTVLCCDKYGEMIVGHPYFDEVSNTNYSAESDNEMMYDCVTWQPLPEPYSDN